ncbi:MAG: molybdenum cofactor biosynthesis protein MoaE [Proteobacteria bacterium]|nr:molybdenum cofactor biosynthesis protein MoaE [Pseudomonadota bacterium]
MIRVQTTDFDPGLELEQLRLQTDGQSGAMVSFTGLVRNLNDGDKISQLTLEHYPGMTEKALAAIEQQAQQRWSLAGTVIIHRVGPLQPNDRIVFVAAASTHRKDAFRACEFMIDALKTDAPFWKKETTPDGTRWVAAARPAQSGAK